MENPSAPLRLRTDILATENPALSKEVLAVSQQPRRHPRQERETENLSRWRVRKDLIESPEADPNGYERILGESDLTGINFLDRGRRAAAAGCRIKLPMVGGGFSEGTGFLVGSRLLMTNNHVIASRLEAAQAEAEFGYEHDID